MAGAGDSLAGVRAGYDRWARVYDHDANPLQALEEPYVRASMGAVRGREVLDLGCGTGRHTAWLADAGARVTAVDFSEGMLEEARQKMAPGARVRFIAHDLHEPLPFADASFDAVLSGLVLEHLRDLRGFFFEAHRVLRPTGRGVISAMHPAMFLRGSQARFTDPDSGERVQPGQPSRIGIGEFVMARARMPASSLTRYRRVRAPDPDFAQALSAGGALRRLADARGALHAGGPTGDGEMKAPVDGAR